MLPLVTTTVRSDQVVSGSDREVRIRLATIEDLDRLIPVDREAFGKLAYPVFVLRQLFDVHGDCWLVAEHSTGLVGYALSAPTLDRDSWLLALAVSAKFRGMGYGRELLRESLKILRKHQIRDLKLTVEPRNHPAISLYLREGFTKKELKKDYLGPGEDRILMELILR
jgi:ribosomal-protein-alanine N-acetyltransferase